jgi:hypothetical protein
MAMKASAVNTFFIVVVRGVAVVGTRISPDISKSCRPGSKIQSDFRSFGKVAETAKAAAFHADVISGGCSSLQSL